MCIPLSLSNLIYSILSYPILSYLSCPILSYPILSYPIHPSIYMYIHMCICVYMCICAYVYMCTCIHVYMYICIHVVICICIYVIICICICICTCTCTYTYWYIFTGHMKQRNQSKMDCPLAFFSMMKGPNVGMGECDFISFICVNWWLELQIDRCRMYRMYTDLETKWLFCRQGDPL